MKFEVDYGYVHYCSGKCIIEARNEQEARKKFDNGDYTIVEDGSVCDVGEFKIEEIYELKDE